MGAGRIGRHATLLDVGRNGLPPPLGAYKSPTVVNIQQTEFPFNCVVDGDR